MRPYQADVAPRHQKREDFAVTALIRPLRPDEAASYREIRLEALRLHPEAFGSSFEQEASHPLTWFAERLTGSVIFGAFRDGLILGTAGFMVQAGPKRAHKGMLWGMYVRASERGSGLSGRLVDTVLDHARGRVELIQLTVVSGNAAASRLYASRGFVAYGIEERALKVEGRYLDDVLMVKMPL
jgi:GNAT superfamily N-acetyltransferase